jgi:hypothetical protein
MQLLVDCSGTTSRHWGKPIGIEDIAQCRWLAAFQVLADLSFGGRNSYGSLATRRSWRPDDAAQTGLPTL